MPDDTFLYVSSSITLALVILPMLNAAVKAPRLIIG
jgi:hypothetical protein